MMDRGPEPRLPDTSNASSGAFLALAVSLALAILVVVTLPSSPWWLAGDCDGTYLGSALNLYGGTPPSITIIRDAAADRAHYNARSGSHAGSACRIEVVRSMSTRCLRTWAVRSG